MKIELIGRGFGDSERIRRQKPRNRVTGSRKAEHHQTCLGRRCRLTINESYATSQESTDEYESA